MSDFKEIMSKYPWSIKRNPNTPNTVSQLELTGDQWNWFELECLPLKYGHMVPVPAVTRLVTGTTGYNLERHMFDSIKVAVDYFNEQYYANASVYLIADIYQVRTPTGDKIRVDFMRVENAHVNNP